MTELGPDARSLLEAARGGDEPTSEDHAHVRAAVAARLIVGVAAAGAAGTVAKAAGASVGGTAGGAASAVAVPIGVTTKAILVVALVSAAGVGTAVVVRSSPPATAPVAARLVPSAAPRGSAGSTPGVAISTPPPVATPSAEASASPTRISSQASESPTPSSESASANSSRPSASPSPPSASVSAGPMAPSHTRAPATDVEAEVLLIAGVHSALQADDPARALILLDEHARRFPAGALGEERDASRVASLCALGRNAEARAAAARFLGAFPNSPHAARVRASCGAAEEPPF
jgi:hypothetical protein